jgi:predicted DNA-binding protein (MmcQ/YjbR family)
VTRPSGYYWVKFKVPPERANDPVTENGWEVAYYHEGRGWYSIWDGGAYADDDLEEIQPNKLYPEKK